MSARIYVVDDSPVTAGAARHYLEAVGYQVEVLPDGPTALRAVEQKPPDLILLDVVMPGIDGFEVCRRLRQTPAGAGLPIIMLTGESTISDKKRGFEAGADDYLLKPVEAAELQMRVAAQLRRVKRAGSAPVGRVITVFSLRGGAGCSSLAVNLAVGLAQLWRQPVPLVDLVRPVGVCDAMLNLRPARRLDDLVGHKVEDLDDELVAAHLTPHESGVHLLAGFAEPVQAEVLSESLVSVMIDQLRQGYGHVVIDTAHDLSPVTVAALDIADQVVLPLAPELNAMRLVSTTLNVFKALGYQKDPALVVNWVFPKQGLQRVQIEKALQKPVEAVIPHSETAWVNAINSGVPVLAGQADPALAALLEDLAWRVSDPAVRKVKPANPSPVWQKVVQRLNARREK
ncbi:MAG: response regulator [Anaerolineales bacterium]|nr:response regulator [Anaerolineales bacterium]